MINSKWYKLIIHQYQVDAVHFIKSTLYVMTVPSCFGLVHHYDEGVQMNIYNTPYEQIKLYPAVFWSRSTGKETNINTDLF